jgi:hypothetical protein
MAYVHLYYVHHRLLWNPELDIEDLQQEYFSAFGPAASHVAEYFDYWEKYSKDRPTISEVSALERLRRPRGHCLAFAEKAYSPAQAILDKALEAARADPLAYIDNAIVEQHFIRNLEVLFPSR